MKALDGDVADEGRFIVYQVGAASFATPLLSIKEIVDPLPYCAVPNDNRAFLGLANLRGQILGIVDVGLTLGTGSSLDSGQGVLLVFEVEGSLLGALVSRVDSAITLESAPVLLPEHHADKVRPEAYLGVIRHESLVLPVISLHHLFESKPLEPSH